MKMSKIICLQIIPSLKIMKKLFILQAFRIVAMVIEHKKIIKIKSKKNKIKKKCTLKIEINSQSQEIYKIIEILLINQIY
jgi:hypothetical protein